MLSPGNGLKTQQTVWMDRVGADEVCSSLPLLVSSQRRFRRRPQGTHQAPASAQDHHQLDGLIRWVSTGLLAFHFLIPLTRKTPAYLGRIQ